MLIPSNLRLTRKEASKLKKPKTNDDEDYVPGQSNYYKLNVLGIEQFHLTEIVIVHFPAIGKRYTKISDIWKNDFPSHVK